LGPDHRLTQPGWQEMHVRFNLELIPFEEPSRERSRSVTQERAILKHGNSYYVRTTAST